MMLAMLLTAAAAAPPQLPPSADHRARATASVGVRIVAGARIAAGELQDEALPPLRETIIRSEGGSLRPARLVEFE